MTTAIEPIVLGPDETALAPNDNRVVSLYSTDGLFEALMDMVEKEVADARKADVTTKTGRDLMRSKAAMVASLKVKVDDIGNKLNADARDAIKKNNALRTAFVDRLQTVQNTVRAPLTEWETAETARVAEVDRVITKMVEMGRLLIDDTAATIQARIDRLEAATFREGVFSDRLVEAQTVRETAVKELEIAHHNRVVIEAQAARVAELEAKQAARDAEDAARDAQARAEQEERERQAQVQAEAERLTNQRLEQAMRDQQANHDREVARLQQQRLDEQAEAQRLEHDRQQRQRDADHRQTIHQAIEAAFLRHDAFTTATAFEAATLVMNGEIPHVTVNY